MAKPIFVGCAGWSVPRAEQERFPKEGSHLERYAAVFPVVEINTSFYRPHRPETYDRWRNSVPETFRFSVKIPRTITHERRLQNADELVERFLAEVRHLGKNLGCLLVQLPPSLRFDQAVAERFFDKLISRTSTAIVCEPRHASWFTPTAEAMLAAFGVAHVIADPPAIEHTVPVQRTRTVYVRLHGSPVMYYSAYSPEYLQRLAEHFAHHAADGRTVWCIFDNTANGAAVPNALALMANCSGG